MFINITIFTDYLHAVTVTKGEKDMHNMQFKLY